MFLHLSAELHWGEYTETVFFREYPFVKLLLLYLVEYDSLQLKIRMGHNLLFWASLLSRPFYMQSKFPKVLQQQKQALIQFAVNLMRNMFDKDSQASW